MGTIVTDNDLRTNGWAPVGSYALLSDMDATALVATDGAVDWLAAPHMDSPPICAALLDPGLGGSITLRPARAYELTRSYLPGTLVLQTSYRTDTGTVRITDALNRGSIGQLPWTELARRIDVLEGSVPMIWSVLPGHGLTADQPWCWIHDGTPRMTVGTRQLAVIADGLGAPAVQPCGLRGQFTAEHDHPLVLGVVISDGEPVFVPSAQDICSRLQRTQEHWEHWSNRIRYDGPWRETVVRSALTIKALTSETTGAIAAAATTSLPEKIGAGRNFDYRYSWIRDSSFAVDAMHRLCLSEEVHGSMAWLVRAASQQGPQLSTFYAMDDSMVSATTREVDVPGYHNSQPVLVGNQAADQTQLGCYGDLLDCIWQHIRAGGRLDAATGELVVQMADRTCRLWHIRDAGIWELNDAQHYTISKIGCWVALDRAIRMSQAGELASLRVDRWRSERDRIRDWVDEHCWSQVKGSYTFYAGTDDLDAAVLLAARTGFCAPDDPRLAGTIDAIQAELTADRSLLYRYSGQQEAEGAFMACSGWLVEALVHIGRIGQATELFADLAARSNDLGLYAEETDPRTGDALGNIPQVLSHLAVIGAATALARAGSDQKTDTR